MPNLSIPLAVDLVGASAAPGIPLRSLALEHWTTGAGITLGAGGGVAAWEGQISGVTVEQTTEANQPPIQQSAYLRGANVIKFDSAGQFLDVTADATLGAMMDTPKEVFYMVQAKLMQFVETKMEKQIRVNGEWEALEKGKLTALQFEPAWEARVADLDQVGLGKNTTELLLAYLKKSGPTMAAEIQRDQRPWPDGQGDQ